MYALDETTMENWDLRHITATVKGEPAEEAKVLKVFTFGHSLTTDSCHMLNLVAAAQGMGEYDELVVGTLYYSGCKLSKHVELIETGNAEYNFYLSSSKTPEEPPVITKGVSADYGLLYDYWDVIVLQGGTWETDKPENLTNGNIQIIQNYVNEHKMNPNAVFAWHSTWTLPTDDALLDMYPKEPNVHKVNFAKYDMDPAKLHAAYINGVKNHVLTDEAFELLIPTGTAVENARTSYLTDRDIFRDYGHASDLGRVIAAYTWYCKLLGIERLDQIKLDAIPVAFFKSTTGTEDRVLTEMEKAIILESVNNTLANPLQLTQSQYTEAPAQ